jgi:Zn-dependent M28 family amino/carboxypeptidase
LLKKQMLLWTASIAVLVALDAAYAATGQIRPALYIGMTAGSLVPLVLMLQIVWTNRIVPGANDNLTGCSAVVSLADRLRENVPDDVELVYVISGCEESGRGGAWNLLRAMRGRWSPSDTTVIGLDTLSGGTLRYHVEGEILPRAPGRELCQCAQEVALADPRFRGFGPYHPPAGATDVAPFLWHGFDAICLVRVDPQTDIPRNYHVPTDTHANVDFQEVSDAVDYAEALVLALVHRYGRGGERKSDQRIEAA